MSVGAIVMVLALAVTLASCGGDSADTGQASERAGGQPQNEPVDRPDLGGVWVSLLTSMEDRRWTIENRVCYRCTLAAMEHLRTVLDDPTSADRPLEEIMNEVEAFNEKYVSGLLTQAARAFQAKFKPEDDPVLACQPVGLFTQDEGILPMRIEQYDDRVVFSYEYFESVRTVYMDGRGHPADLAPSRLGHSIGWYDGETLVIDTIGVEPHLIKRFNTGGIRVSSQARGIERYTRGKDGNSMDLEITIVDPRTFHQPLILTKAFRYAPKEKLGDFECEDGSGRNVKRED